MKNELKVNKDIKGIGQLPQTSQMPPFIFTIEGQISANSAGNPNSILLQNEHHETNYPRLVHCRNLLPICLSGRPGRLPKI